jgi:hypothetical protein
MLRDTYSRITLVVMATMACTVMVLMLSDLLGYGDGLRPALMTAAFMTVAVGYGAVMMALVRRNPAPLSISLLGFPGSGKTVFLTVLFDALMSTAPPGLAFWPYGAETVEQVGEDVRTLMQRKWLPPTAPGQVFFYRANARVGSGMLARRYKIEIGDYAGEHIHEFDTDHERWLHRTDYYKYVLQSDIVMLSVDCGTVLRSTSAERRRMEDSFVAALHLLMEHKGVAVGGKLRAPVALVFMKADLAASLELSSLRERRPDVVELCKRVPTLVQFCQNRCVTFKAFVASSVGHVEKDGRPPEAIKPWGVIDPVAWALRHA